MGKGKEQERADQRWDPERKPTLGGIALYIVFLFCFSLSYGLYFDGGQKEGIWMTGLLGAASLGFLMGLSDDVYETRPFLKLAVQSTCAIVLVISQTVLQMPGPAWIDIAATLLWVILLMNSFNMVDNMDGVAGGIALTVIAATMFQLWSLQGAASSFWPVLIGILAGVLGFLRYNVNPSSMFLGDAGTQFLGLFLAFLGIRFFWNAPEPAITSSAWGALERVLVLMLLFWSSLADTISVFVLRIIRGGSPLKGGKDHTTHALSYAGWSDRAVNLFFFIFSGLNVFLALTLQRLDGASGLFLAALIGYIFLTFAVLYANAHRNGEKRLTS